MYRARIMREEKKVVEEEKKSEVKKNKLKYNKTDIKRTITGKFMVEVYPSIVDEEKVEKYRTIITTGISEEKEDRTMDHVRDLDRIQKWKFIGKSGEDVHCELLQYIVQAFDDVVWACNFEDDKEFERVKKSFNKSIAKAVEKGSMSFGKLQDIIYGHQDIKEEQKEDMEQQVLIEAEDYLNTFEDARDNVIICDDATEAIQKEMRREAIEEAEDRAVSMDGEVDAVEKRQKEEENMYESD